MIAATITIRALGPDTGAETYEDWAHKGDVDLDEFGVWIRGGLSESRTLIPWPAIVRIDWAECRCAECQPRQVAA